MRNLSLGRRHLVNAYEVEAGIGVIEHLYSPRMVEEIKEEKNWNIKQTNSDVT